MDRKSLIGIGGIVVAVTSAEFNDLVSNVAIADIRGGLGIDLDPTSWLRSLYVTGEIIGMCVAPALGVGFSLRRFALFAIALSCLSNVLFALGGPLPVLFALRGLQGLAEGFIIPLLMTVALRLLDPPVRLYGLALYAMTATLIPNLATTVAALWVDVIGDWHWIFWGALPLCTIAAMMVSVGLEQEPPQRNRLAKFDWRGLTLLAIGFGSFSTVLLQGDRLDWYNSRGIALATLVAAVAVPLFLLVEMRAEVPLVRLDLLKRRNFAYATVCLFTFFILSLSSSQVPTAFLEAVQGYRPEQVNIIIAEIAIAQLFLLPATAWLLDHPRVDARWVSALGFAFILCACVGGVFIDSTWTRKQFALLQALQALGQPLVVMPLLMMATTSLSLRRVLMPPPWSIPRARLRKRQGSGCWR